MQKIKKTTLRNPDFSFAGIPYIIQYESNFEENFTPRGKPVSVNNLEIGHFKTEGKDRDLVFNFLMNKTEYFVWTEVEMTSYPVMIPGYHKGGCRFFLSLERWKNENTAFIKYQAL